MNVYHRPQEAAAVLRAAAVAIGNFDGCHLGHRALIDQMKASAKSLGIPSAILTFYPHPVEVLNPNKKPERLTSTSEKLVLFEELGVENVLVVSFNKELSQQLPAEFFNFFVVQALHAKSVHVGFNFTFGKDRLGTTGELKSLCEAQGVLLSVLPSFEYNGQRVSSSLIRQCLKEGRVSHAWELLGRPFRLEGKVVKGSQLGQDLGAPTANLEVAEDKLIPKQGVYVTECTWQKERFLSATNIGFRPTVHKDDQEEAPKKMTIETHILGLKSKVYGEFLSLSFLERLRDEEKFPSLDALKIQIQKDIDRTKAIGAKLFSGRKK